MKIDPRVTDLSNEYVHTSLPRRESNYSRAARYDADAARLAWGRTIAFFDEYLKR
jgi:dienelactone hydrolase